MKKRLVLLATLLLVLCMAGCGAADTNSPVETVPTPGAATEPEQPQEGSPPENDWHYVPELKFDSYEAVVALWEEYESCSAELSGYHRLNLTDGTVYVQLSRTAYDDMDGLTYDAYISDGETDEYVRYSLDGSYMEYRSVQSFDESRNVLVIDGTDYHADGSVQSSSHTESEYDEYGRCVRYDRINYDADGRVEGSSQIQRKYDENGNTTEENEVFYRWIYEDGVPVDECTTLRHTVFDESGNATQKDETDYHAEGSVESTAHYTYGDIEVDGELVRIELEVQRDYTNGSKYSKVFDEASSTFTRTSLNVDGYSFVEEGKLVNGQIYWLSKGIYVDNSARIKESGYAYTYTDSMQVQSIEYIRYDEDGRQDYKCVLDRTYDDSGELICYTYTLETYTFELSEGYIANEYSHQVSVSGAAAEHTYSSNVTSAEKDIQMKLSPLEQELNSLYDSAVVAGELWWYG